VNYDNVRTDSTGWPVGTSTEAMAAITQAVLDFLKKRPEGAELWVIVDYVKNHVPLTVWDRPVVLDYQYATVDRALRAAGAIPVWRL
jgi:hypothetical protein